MATADRSYLVPCACSARVSVTAGQAGGRATCGACGREIDVPRLRDLAAFAVTVSDADVRPSVAAGRGMIVFGTVLAIAAAVSAVCLVPVGRRFFSPPPSAEAIRAAIAAAPLSQIHGTWQTIVSGGVARPPTMEELRLQQFAAHAAGVAWLLWGVAAAGAILAIAGVIRAAAARASAPGVGRS